MIALPAAAALAIGVAFLAQRPAPQAELGTPPAAALLATPRPTPTDVEPLGVFWPVRGRIVFRVGSHLEGHDPDGIGPAVTIEPGDLGLATRMAPVGWSTDGSTLAVSDSDGRGYVLDVHGSLTPVRVDAIAGSADGCCSFTLSPWLSPDGARAVAVVRSADGPTDSLVIFGIANPAAGRRISLDGLPVPPGPPADAMPAWSPSGTEIAYVWEAADGRAPGGRAAGVAILDLSTGHARALAPSWAFVRHVAWSPDGTQIVVVAGADPLVENERGNPLWQPQAAELYRVAVESGDVRVIAAGHFTNAVWSPDGRQIAAIDYVKKRRSVVVVDVDAGQIGELYVLAASASGIQSYQFGAVAWNPAIR